MRATSRLLLAAWVLAWILTALGLGAPPRAGAEPSPQALDAEEEIKRLIVRVEAVVAGATRLGAGIIFSGGPDEVQIATANHVVRLGPQEAQQIEVQFRSLPGKAVRARLLPQRDDAMDLAVLSVTGLKGLPLDSSSLPFDRLGDPQSLQRGDGIFLLGHPRGLPWRVNTAAERFIEHRQDVLDFESNLIAEGHSGGALLNEDRQLVGMLRSDQPPYGAAVSIAAIAKRLQAWGYTVRLRFPAVLVSAGDGRTCLLMPSGVPRCWGTGPFNVPEAIGSMLGVRLKSVSVGGFHVCGVGVNGAGYCTGGNKNGELGDGTTVNRRGAPAVVQGGLTFTAIAAGFGHTCGITADGSAYCWGHGEGGRLGNGSGDDSTIPVLVAGGHKFKAIAAGWYYSCGLLTSGAAYCWGGVGGSGRPREGGMDRPNAFIPVAIPRGETFRLLSAGRQHACGVTPGGKALCWGQNDGALGDGSNQDREEPVAVSGGLLFRTVSAGGGHSCGVANDGTGYCWGMNDFGQLGDGSKTNRNVPVRVTGGLSFESISAGALHTCGVTTDGSVFCWGWNWTGGVDPRGDKEQAVPHRVSGVP